AEQQDESPRDDVDDVVRRERAWLPGGVVLADPRPEDDGDRHGAESAHAVDHRGPREIDVAVAEAQRRAPLGHPSAAPDPASEDRVEDAAHEQLAEQEAAERDAFAAGADDDVAGGLHEHDLEHREHVDAGVVARAAQEEALAAEEAPGAASHQPLIESGRAAQVSWRGVDGGRAVLEG